MNNNYLIIATNDITIKEVSHVNFLFPLQDFSVGFLKEYQLEEITISNAYLYINRLLDTVSIAKLKELLPLIKDNIKGIVFEDLGVYELIKDSRLEKIYYATHANCNKYTIETLLPKMNSIVISPDITTSECQEILQNTSKPLIIYGLGHLACMYSRRTLNTNYAKNFDYPKERILHLKETVTKMPFFSIENNYGTVLYDEKIFLGTKLKDEPNIYQVLINPLELHKDVFELIQIFLSGELEDSTTRFLDQKTIYRLKDIS